MGQYKTVSGQNIYDVCTHIYGSLEGLIDLMVSNKQLSISSSLPTGTVLNYTDNFLTNAVVSSQLAANYITPSNGSGMIKFTEAPGERIADIYCPAQRESGLIKISGTGILYIDWGDNSEYQKINLSQSLASCSHIFNNKVNTERRIRFFGDAHFIDLDFSELSTTAVYFFKPIRVESYVHGPSGSSIEHLKLSEQLYSVSLNRSAVQDLTPLINLTSMFALDLRSDFIKPDKIESYLIQLVENYNSRRGCTITINGALNGVYQQPTKNSEQKYIIKTAMEAVWVLINEPAWQEGGYWHIIINNTDYTTENE